MVVGEKILVLSASVPFFNVLKDDNPLLNILSKIINSGFEPWLLVPIQKPVTKAVESVMNELMLRGVKVVHGLNTLFYAEKFRSVVFDSPRSALMFVDQVMSAYSGPVWLLNRGNSELPKELENRFSNVIDDPETIEFVTDKQEAAIEPLVSIIMVTFNQIKLTRHCLQSLKRYTPEKHELIIVDNGSTDGTVEFLGKMKDTRCIFNEKNLAFARANNQGIEIAKGEYLLLMNNDLILTECWLKKLLAVASSSVDIGVVGPCTNTAAGVQKVTPSYKSIRDLQRYAASFAMRNAGRWISVNRLNAFCFLIKRQVIDSAGVLDERFGPGGYEDYDYCLRVRQAGFRIMLAGDTYIHHVGGQGYEPNQLDYNSLRIVNRQIFVDKWCKKALESLEITPDGV